MRGAPALPRAARLVMRGRGLVINKLLLGLQGSLLRPCSTDTWCRDFILDGGGSGLCFEHLRISPFLAHSTHSTHSLCRCEGRVDTDPWCRDFILDDGSGLGRGSCCTKDEELAAWCGLVGGSV